ncbi:MAG: pyruvate formate lyase family protein, partial [Hungatella sp.]
MVFREPTERIQRMRRKMIDTPASICAERGFIVTKIYQEYEYLPAIELRGKCLEEVLRNMSIYIDDDTLLAGNQASADR